MTTSLVICGPSGSGKSTLLRRLLREFRDFFRFSISHTTRNRRADEENGREYHFINEEVFKQMVREDKFLEWTLFGGNMYGTSWTSLQEVQRSGRIPVLDLELSGVLRVKKLNEFVAKYLLIRTKNLHQLEKNLRNRGTEEEEDIRRRLERAREDLRVIDNSEEEIFDKQIVNEDLDLAFREIKDFLKNDIEEAKRRLNL